MRFFLHTLTVCSKVLHVTSFWQIFQCAFPLSLKHPLSFSLQFFYTNIKYDWNWNLITQPFFSILFLAAL